MASVSNQPQQWGFQEKISQMDTEILAILSSVSPETSRWKTNFHNVFVQAQGILEKYFQPPWTQEENAAAVCICTRIGLHFIAINFDSNSFRKFSSILHEKTKIIDEFLKIEEIPVYLKPLIRSWLIQSQFTFDLQTKREEFQKLTIDFKQFYGISEVFYAVNEKLEWLANAEKEIQQNHPNEFQQIVLQVQGQIEQIILPETTPETNLIRKRFAVFFHELESHDKGSDYVHRLTHWVQGAVKFTSKGKFHVQIKEAFLAELKLFLERMIAREIEALKTSKNQQNFFAIVSWVDFYNKLYSPVFGTTVMDDQLYLALWEWMKGVISDEMFGYTSIKEHYLLLHRFYQLLKEKNIPLEAIGIDLETLWNDFLKQKVQKEATDFNSNFWEGSHPIDDFLDKMDASIVQIQENWESDVKDFYRFDNVMDVYLKSLSIQQIGKRLRKKLDVYQWLQEKFYNETLEDGNEAPTRYDAPDIERYRILESLHSILLLWNQLQSWIEQYKDIAKAQGIVVTDFEELEAQRITTASMVIKRWWVYQKKMIQTYHWNHKVFDREVTNSFYNFLESAKWVLSYDEVKAEIDFMKEQSLFLLQIHEIQWKIQGASFYSPTQEVIDQFTQEIEKIPQKFLQTQEYIEVQAEFSNKILEIIEEKLRQGLYGIYDSLSGFIDTATDINLAPLYPELATYSRDNEFNSRTTEERIQLILHALSLFDGKQAKRKYESLWGEYGLGYHHSEFIEILEKQIEPFVAFDTTGKIAVALPAIKSILMECNYKFQN